MMNEDDVRSIVLEVLDEIAVAQQAVVDQQNARRADEYAKHRAHLVDVTAEAPDDGEFTRHIKRILRGEEPVA